MASTVEVGPDRPLNIGIESGVNEKLEPFCTVRLNDRAAGQLAPHEVRAMAMQWLEAAAAAELDALVVQELRESVGLDLNTAGHFVVGLRNRRETLRESGQMP